MCCATAILGVMLSIWVLICSKCEYDEPNSEWIYKECKHIRHVVRVILWYCVRYICLGTILESWNDFVHWNITQTQSPLFDRPKLRALIWWPKKYDGQIVEQISNMLNYGWFSHILFHVMVSTYGGASRECRIKPNRNSSILIK